MPGVLIGRKQIQTGSISGPERKFSKNTGKTREALAFFSFTTANVPVSMPHALGHKPTGYTVISQGNASGTAPGTVYLTHDSTAGTGGTIELCSTKQWISLASSQANSWALVKIY